MLKYPIKGKVTDEETQKIDRKGIPHRAHLKGEKSKHINHGIPTFLLRFFYFRFNPTQGEMLNDLEFWTKTKNMFEFKRDDLAIAAKRL